MRKHERKPPSPPQPLNLVLIERMSRIRADMTHRKARAMEIAEILKKVACPEAAAVLREFNAMIKAFPRKIQRGRANDLKPSERTLLSKAREQLEVQAAEQAKLAPTVSVPATELMKGVNGALGGQPQQFQQHTAE